MAARTAPPSSSSHYTATPQRPQQHSYDSQQQQQQQPHNRHYNAYDEHSHRHDLPVSSWLRCDEDALVEVAQPHGAHVALSECLFSIGNGAIGIRGYPEETSNDGMLQFYDHMTTSGDWRRGSGAAGMAAASLRAALPQQQLLPYNSRHHHHRGSDAAPLSHRYATNSDDSVCSIARSTASSSSSSPSPHPQQQQQQQQPPLPAAHTNNNNTTTTTLRSLDALLSHRLHITLTPSPQQSLRGCYFSGFYEQSIYGSGAAAGAGSGSAPPCMSGIGSIGVSMGGGGGGASLAATATTTATYCPHLSRSYHHGSASLVVDGLGGGGGNRSGGGGGGGSSGSSSAAQPALQRCESFLVAAPDAFCIDVFLSGEHVSEATGRIVAYQRRLDLRTGELHRRLTWESHLQNHEVTIDSVRFASLENVNIAAERYTVTVRNANKADIRIVSRLQLPSSSSGRSSSHHHHHGSSHDGGDEHDALPRHAAPPMLSSSFSPPPPPSARSRHSHCLYSTESISATSSMHDATSVMVVRTRNSCRRLAVATVDVCTSMLLRDSAATATLSLSSPLAGISEGTTTTTPTMPGMFSLHSHAASTTTAAAATGGGGAGVSPDGNNNNNNVMAATAAATTATMAAATTAAMSNASMYTSSPVTTLSSTSPSACFLASSNVSNNNNNNNNNSSSNSIVVGGGGGGGNNGGGGGGSAATGTVSGSTMATSNNSNNSGNNSSSGAAAACHAHAPHRHHTHSPSPPLYPSHHVTTPTTGSGGGGGGAGATSSTPTSATRTRNVLVPTCTESDSGTTTTFTSCISDDVALELVKYVGYYGDDDARQEEMYDMAIYRTRHAAHFGFDALREEHRRGVRRYWQSADVVLHGATAMQGALRYNVLQLRMSASRHARNGYPTRGLTGMMLGGLHQWDVDAMVLPFLAHVCPDRARTLLLFRIHTLDHARSHASSLDLARGALYPFRTLNGMNSNVPYCSAFLFVNAVVALAMRYYVQCTGDDSLLLRDGGAEVVLATALVWLEWGRVEDDGAFHLRTVSGPDLYNGLVDDNFFTNLVAQRHLRWTVALAARLRGLDGGQVWRQLLERCHASDEDVAQMAHAARHMYLGFDVAHRVNPADRSFMLKKKWSLEELRNSNNNNNNNNSNNNEDNNYEDGGQRRRHLSQRYNPSVIFRHQLCRVPDVMLAVMLLPQCFSDDDARSNFHFYERVTSCDSALRNVIFGITAARLRMTHAVTNSTNNNSHNNSHVAGAAATTTTMTTATHYFRQSLFIDVHNVVGDTAGGLHSTTAAGSWLTLTMGYGGMRVVDDDDGDDDAKGELHFDPQLPDGVDAFAFVARHRGCVVHVRVTARLATYRLVEAPAGVHDLVLYHARNTRVHLRLGGSPVMVRLLRELRLFAYDAVVFDLDSVIANIEDMHYAAWKAAIEEFLASQHSATPHDDEKGGSGGNHNSSSSTTSSTAMHAGDNHHHHHTSSSSSSSRPASATASPTTAMTPSLTSPATATVGNMATASHGSRSTTVSKELYLAYLRHNTPLSGLKEVLRRYDVPLLPVGSPHDADHAHTLYGLCNRKLHLFRDVVRAGQRDVRIRDGAMALLTSLRACGMLIGCVTGSKNGHWLLREQAELRVLFDHVIDANDGEHAGLRWRPELDYFEACAKALDVARERVVVVVDDVHSFSKKGLERYCMVVGVGRDVVHAPQLSVPTYCAEDFTGVTVEVLDECISGDSTARLLTSAAGGSMSSGGGGSSSNNNNGGGGGGGGGNKTMTMSFAPLGVQQQMTM